MSEGEFGGSEGTGYVPPEARVRARTSGSSQCEAAVTRKNGRLPTLAVMLLSTFWLGQKLNEDPPRVTPSEGAEE